MAERDLPRSRHARLGLDLGQREDAGFLIQWQDWERYSSCSLYERLSLFLSCRFRGQVSSLLLPSTQARENVRLTVVAWNYTSPA
jgi:hypothetical protein